MTAKTNREDVQKVKTSEKDEWGGILVRLYSSIFAFRLPSHLSVLFVSFVLAVIHNL